MKKHHKLYFKLLGGGFALALAGGGMYAVEWLQIPGVVLIVAGVVLLLVAQIYWWIFV